MKIIESASTYRAYNKQNVVPPALADALQNQGRSKIAASTQNTDQISLSGKAPRNEELSKLTQGIASELATSVPASRIQSLKNAVENGEYYVPTSQLADNMLNIQG